MKTMKTQNPWKTLEIHGFYLKNHEKTMKTHETPWNPMKNHEILSKNIKPMKNHENLWKTMKTHENQWKPMKTHENPWKPMKTHENRKIH